MAINDESTTSDAADNYSFYEPDTPASTDENDNPVAAVPGKVKELSTLDGTETSSQKERNEVHIEEIHGPHYRYRHGFEYQETRGNKVDLRYKEATTTLPDRQESLQGNVGGAAHSEQNMVKILSHIEQAITLLNEVYGTTFSLHKGDKQEVHIGTSYNFQKGDQFNYVEGTTGDASIIGWGSTKEFNYGCGFTVNYVDKSPSDHKNDSTSGPLIGKGFDAAKAEEDARPFLHSHWITESAALVEATVGDKYEMTTGVAVDVHHGARHEYLLGWDDSMSFAGGAELHLAARSETYIGLKNENLIAGAICTAVGFRLDVEMGPHTTLGTETFDIKALQSDMSITDLHTKVNHLGAVSNSISACVTEINAASTNIESVSTKLEAGVNIIKTNVLEVNG